jgi:hypothetical protein
MTEGTSAFSSVPSHRNFSPAKAVRRFTINVFAGVFPSD